MTEADLVPEEDLILSSDDEDNEPTFDGPYAAKARELHERDKHIEQLETSPLTKF